MGHGYELLSYLKEKSTYPTQDLTAFCKGGFSTYTPKSEVWKRKSDWLKSYLIYFGGRVSCSLGSSQALKEDEDDLVLLDPPALQMLGLQMCTNTSCFLCSDKNSNPKLHANWVKALYQLGYILEILQFFKLKSGNCFQASGELPN